MGSATIGAAAFIANHNYVLSGRKLDDLVPAIAGALKDHCISPQTLGRVPQFPL